MLTGFAVNLSNHLVPLARASLDMYRELVRPDNTPSSYPSLQFSCPHKHPAVHPALLPPPHLIVLEPATAPCISIADMSTMMGTGGRSLPLSHGRALTCSDSLRQNFPRV